MAKRSKSKKHGGSKYDGLGIDGNPCWENAPDNVKAVFNNERYIKANRDNPEINHGLKWGYKTSSNYSDGLLTLNNRDGDCESYVDKARAERHGKKHASKPSHVQENAGDDCGSKKTKGRGKANKSETTNEIFARAFGNNF